MSGAAKYALPILGVAAAATGIGALAAPLFAGGTAAAAGASAAAGLGATSAALTAGPAAMGGALSAGAGAGLTSFAAAPIGAGLVASAAPAAATALGGTAAGIGSTLGNISKGLSYTSSGLAPLLNTQALPRLQATSGIQDMRSFARPYLQYQ